MPSAAESELAGKIRKVIREVPDFPKPGINFYDITTILSEPVVFIAIIELLAERYADSIDVVAGIEARGFIFAPALALKLGKPFVPLRKPGKLPAAVEKITYALEYGEDSLEIHQDAIAPRSRTLIVDDLVATGGTAKAAVDLVSRLGGTVAGCAFVIELSFLNARQKLAPTEVYSLVTYDS